MFGLCFILLFCNQNIEPRTKREHWQHENVIRQQGIEEVIFSGRVRRRYSFFFNYYYLCEPPFHWSISRQLSVGCLSVLWDGTSTEDYGGMKEAPDENRTVSTRTFFLAFQKYTTDTVGRVGSVPALRPSLSTVSTSKPVASLATAVGPAELWFYYVTILWA